MPSQRDDNVASSDAQSLTDDLASGVVDDSPHDTVPFGISGIRAASTDRATSTTHEAPSINHNTAPDAAASSQAAMYSTLDSALSISRSPRTEDPLASRQQVNMLIEAFFSHVHPVEAMSFLRRGQLVRDIREALASPLLVKAICTVSFRFLPNNAEFTHPDGGCLPERWGQEIKNEIMADTDRVSMSKLASILCVIHHESNSGRVLSSWLLISLAARMALAMGLDRSPESDPASVQSPWISAEIERRLMWSVVCFDALGSAGFDKYRLCPEQLEIPLPSSERDFAAGHAPAKEAPKLVEVDDVSPTLSGSETLEFFNIADGARRSSKAGYENDGFMARWVRLMILRRDVLA